MFSTSSGFCDCGYFHLTVGQNKVLSYILNINNNNDDGEEEEEEEKEITTRSK